MNHTIDKDSWVFVVVQDPGKNETIVAQRDSEHDLSFIPVFQEKNTAIQGIPRLAKAPGHIFEIQAIIYDDLLIYAQEHSVLLFFLDGEGRILSKAGPDGRPL
jgi:hypothetical protein